MSKWEKTNEALVYDGYRKIVRRTYKLPNGESADFDVVRATGGVAVLAITDRNQVVCFRQFRPGPEETLLELPGGILGEHEDPLSAVNKELMEETGYQADVSYLGAYYRDAYMTGSWHMFVGRNAKHVSEPQHEAHEFGQLALVPLQTFRQNLFAGQLTDSTLGYAGLNALGLL